MLLRPDKSFGHLKRFFKTMNLVWVWIYHGSFPLGLQHGQGLRPHLCWFLGASLFMS